MRRQLLEDGDRGGLIVDEDAGLAGREDLAAKNDLVGVGVEAVGFEGGGEGFRIGVEESSDDGAVAAVANDVGRRFFAEEQGEGVDEDGLASAGFAGQEVKAGAALHDHVVDDGVVFDAKLEQQERAL